MAARWGVDGAAGWDGMRGTCPISIEVAPVLIMQCIMGQFFGKMC